MVNSTMSETKRLELIAEAVRYCQRVSAMGMPKSAYSKALREPIHFLWELRFGRKVQVAQYLSKAAVGTDYGVGMLVYDHAVPFNYLAGHLLALESVDIDAVKAILENYDIKVIITKEDDRALRSAGLNSKMPRDWDGIDPLARYREVGVELVSNDNYNGKTSS